MNWDFLYDPPHTWCVPPKGVEMPSDVLGAHLDTWTDGHERLVAAVAGYLARFSYKPGWHFTVNRRPELRDGVFVQVVFRTSDSRAADRYGMDEFACPRCGSVNERASGGIPIAGQFGVPPRLLQSRDPEGLFRHWLRTMIGDMELHERDEWFRWDGKLPYDPHVGMMASGARGP